MVGRAQSALLAWLVFSFTAGCGRVSFELVDPDASTSDAAVLDGAGLDGAGLDGAGLDGGSPRCPDDPRLAGCWLLDGDGVDGSPAARPLALSAITFIPGAVGEALERGPSSSARVNATVSDPFPALGIELWARPDAIPAFGRAGLLDKDGQFGLFLYSTAELRCTAGGSEAACGPLRAGEWHHVACTQDGTALILYLDGRECARGPGGPVAGGTSPVTIGEDSPFGGDEWRGALDEVRLWRRALGPAEVCAAAGGC